MLDNRRALDQFLASVERRAFRMAEIATSRTEEARDIVQDAMFGFVRHYGDNPDSQWKTLFYRVLQSRIRDWYRRQKVRNRWRIWLRPRQGAENGGEDPLATLADPHPRDPADAVAMSRSMSMLQEALHSLSRRQQQVFLLRAWEGLDVIATAKAMNCSPSSVKTHYARALSALRHHLEGHWP